MRDRGVGAPYSLECRGWYRRVLAGADRGSFVAVCCGVDGCAGGWISVRSSLDGHDLSVSLHRRFVDLLASLGTGAVVAVDMPIGLTASGPRACDREARRYLGFPRSASVFPAPIRPALRARTWEQACAIRERVDRKRYQIQAFGLFAKVREVDTLLRAEPRYQNQVFEAHPEVTFAAMNDGLRMAHSKKRPAGRKERLAIIERCLGPEAMVLYEDACRKRRRASASSEHEFGGFARKKVGRDDLIDALALVWAARRIATGEHRMLPEFEDRDPMGLRMNIHY